MTTSIYLGLVSKTVDTNPRMFLDEEKYWAEVRREAEIFFRRVPGQYVGSVSEEVFQDERTMIWKESDSYVDVSLGVKPDYFLLIGNDRVHCPIFDLFFKNVNRRVTSDILDTALDQFYLFAGDIDPGTLSVAEVTQEGSILSRDLELLSRYCPGRELEVRTDWQAGNCMMKYTVPRREVIEIGVVHGH